MAVQCPEEPYVPPLRPGDVDVRSHARSRFDSADLVVEVRSKRTSSRQADR